MELLDTLPAKHCEMVAAVEMLDSLWMHLAQLLRQRLLILVIELEVCLGQNGVLLNDLIKDIDV